MLWVESQVGYCPAALMGAGLALVTALSIRPMALESRALDATGSESLPGKACSARSMAGTESTASIESVGRAGGRLGAAAAGGALAASAVVTIAGAKAGPAVSTGRGAVSAVADESGIALVCGMVGRGAASARGLDSEPGAAAETTTRVHTIAMAPRTVSWIGRRIQDRDG